MDNDNKHLGNKEEKEMSVLENKLTTDMKLLLEIAENNTKRNSDGQTVSDKDCPYREDPRWELSIKKLK